MGSSRFVMILVASLIVVGMFSVVVGADEPLSLENRVSTLEALHGIDRSTPTDVPTSTAEATATHTAVPSTATNTAVPPTATNTAVPQGCSVPSGTDVWHAPTDHEHGDAPPAWADAWSCEQFGHPVIFGGDEATPLENSIKHNAFKGYTFNVTADNGSTVAAYGRVHMQTNPHGRTARFHSCEWFFKDATGAISLFQWWCDFGPSPAMRFNANTSSEQNAFIVQYNPANLMTGSTENATREFWYTQRNEGNSDWAFPITVHVFDASTHYNPGEEASAHDMGTWDATGYYGLDRQISFRWAVQGSTFTNVQGQPYLTRNMTNPRGWFCTDVYAVIVELNVSGAAVCAAGDLPQYIASTLPEMMGTASYAPGIRKLFPGSGNLTLPN